MEEKTWRPKSEPVNEAVVAVVGMIYHHTAHFLMTSQDGVYNEAQLPKAKVEIAKLLATAKNPGLISKAEELSKVLDVINPGDKVDHVVVEKIEALRNAMRTERKY